MQDANPGIRSVEEMLKHAVRDMNTRIPYKRKPVNSIAECLGCKSAAKLRALGKLLSVGGLSKMRKADLISALSEKLSDSGVFRSLLSESPWEEYVLFKKVSETDETRFNIDDRVEFIHLHAVGLMQAFSADDGFVLIVPDEIKSLWFENRDEIDRKISVEHRIDVYALAGVRLYGMISTKDLASVFNRYESDEVSVTDVRRAILTRVAAAQPYYLWDEYVVSPVFGDDFDGLMKLKDELKRMPRRDFDKETLLLYSSGDHLSECDAAKDILNFIADITGDERFAASLVFELSDLCSCGASMDACFGLIYNCGIEFADKAQTQGFSERLNRLWQDTRLWSFGGRTPNEMEKSWWIDGPWADRERIKRLGRNDPCPCESGLKYKKCCGA